MACEGGQIVTHKIVVATFSPVLKDILELNLSKTPVIYLRGVKFEHLESLINFMYQGEVNIAQENLKSVITSLIYTDVSPRNKLFITLNQWFDESLLLEENIQPLYFPSINKQNLETFNKKFVDTYNSKPNHLSLLSYDLLGLIYYLSLKFFLHAL